MSKKLKNFIDENRREFDDELPSNNAWHKIEQSIGVKKPAKQFSVRIYIFSILYRGNPGG